MKKVIYSVSSSAYGDTSTLPKTETMEPKPLSPYAIIKLTGEYYYKIFYEIYGLPTTSLRYFNVYDPRQYPSSQYAAVIPKFINAVLKSEWPIIYGDGKQTRDFTFIKDAVEANILVAESLNANGETINVAGGKNITINKLAEKIIKSIGINVKPKHTDPKSGDVRHSLADILKAKKLLNCEPKWSLDKGLKVTIE